eukprot:NODE_207_length_14754_cov_0.677994.p2 type:complete len:927 gc:universal NODE_207_length_14754_cov_0.677994:611-3391(+)
MMKFETRSVSLMLRTIKRSYIEASNVFGYRTAREFELPDYSPEEHQNRIQNSNLLRLVSAFRQHGHRASEIDPLGMATAEDVKDLHLHRYGLDINDKVKYNLKGILHLGKPENKSQGLPRATIKDIYKYLRSSYCGRIGYEFCHIPNSSERRWFQFMVESLVKVKFDNNEKLRINSLLLKSELFDQFMHRKFPSLKRYGLEGAESFLVSLDYLFESACNTDVKEIVLCTAHRGRLNMLADLLNYPLDALFNKIKGNPEFPEKYKGYYLGDVISHLSIDAELKYHNKTINVSLLNNPSHLEAVNPVALGRTRARQIQMYESNSEPDCRLGDKAMCVQVHGDAAFSGQGIIMESLGLSNLPHFSSGGSIHIIVNNQIGYTTQAANYRSSLYASDVGKMISCPVIHVNGDYPEDVALATRIAYEYRNKFRKDCILDIISYRYQGHNELDDPSFTQPSMYNRIRNRKSPPAVYRETNKIDNMVIKQHSDEFNNKLQSAFEISSAYKPSFSISDYKWDSMSVPSSNIISPKTGVKIETLRLVGLNSVECPSLNKVHPRLMKYHINDRIEKINQSKPLDWATCESMAIGSLLLEKIGVRISGQDVGRGTFSQRHWMLVDQETEAVWIPLNLMSSNQSKLEVANSSLSEFAVMGFEFGISWESPQRLCIWEAQFGDFFNTAQVIIDQFIASGEAKWFKQSGLVLLLPHGQDGTGPEHSSCRIERFLQLADDKCAMLDTSNNSVVNMHVVNVTTPAQYFHVLRRQMVRNYRKPLIVASPKILLRHPLCTSSIDDMGPGTTFEPVLNDPKFIKGEKSLVETVLFCSGKIFYDLLAEREQRKINSVAIVRIEELCPFPIQGIMKLLEDYKNVKEYKWAQEEHQNQGAWSYVSPRLENRLNAKISYVGREPSAAAATGVSIYHKEEVKVLFDLIFKK